ncbi:MAG: 3'-5' exonuclease, partial [Kineosporiaceae bacterium]
RDLEALGSWAHRLRDDPPEDVPPGGFPPQEPPPHEPPPGESPADGPPTGDTGPAGSADSADPAPGRDRRAGVSYDAVEEVSLVEAIDQLPPEGWRGPAGQELSGPARVRLVRLAAVLRGLRGRTALPLPDLVLDVQRALLLDIEVAAVPGTSPAAARAHLDAFVDVAAAFADSGERTGLGPFLGWLAAADTRERGLDSPVGQVRPDAVQILTVHAAKGLEWDVVAVTGLVEGVFPSRSGRGETDLAHGWLGDLGALPYPLRGDADGLPHWAVDRVASQQELADELDDFRARCGAHEIAEERRLGYVAFTRARRRLLLTGAVWGDGTTPRRPSRFLTEVAELAGSVPGISTLAWAQAPDRGADNPRDALTPRAAWPRDTLGDRRPALVEAARMVTAERDRLDRADRAAAADPAAADADVDPATAARTDTDPDTDADTDPDTDADTDTEADAGPPGPSGDGASPWATELTVLLAERDDTARRGLAVELPGQLTASRMVALAADPQRLALDLRRPMPQPPSPAARRGSAFHTWLERRFQAAALVELEDLPGAADDRNVDLAAGEDLDALQRGFLTSEWAARTPVAVEVSVETPLAGFVLRGRIDAVFAEAGPDGPRWDVVDWKTGIPPSAPDQVRARAVQLAVYRLAWARLSGVAVDRVSAAFFHPLTGQTVRPVDVLDEAGLLALISAVPSGPE